MDAAARRNNQATGRSQREHTVCHRQRQGRRQTALTRHDRDDRGFQLDKLRTNSGQWPRPDRIPPLPTPQNAAGVRQVDDRAVEPLLRLRETRRKALSIALRVRHAEVAARPYSPQWWLAAVQPITSPVCR